MILIVDDQQENILPLQKILAMNGLESEAANSGEEALFKILKNDYSLIVMDVQMPGMDGFEVVETLSGSNRTKDIPVIFLSAINKEKKYISKGYASGGVEYLTKPVDADLFILKVKTFVKLFEQQKELKAIKDLLSKEIEIRKKAQDQLTRTNENLEQAVAERTVQLTRKNEELERSNNELQQFNWVVSHDLKEPLRKIDVFLKLISEKYTPADETGKHYIDRTLKASDRMKNLISDLLDFSGLSAKVSFEKASLFELLEDTITDLDWTIEQKNARVETQRLPVAQVVPGQIRQVFHNLLGNALKFGKPGEQPVISVSFDLCDERSFEAPAVPNGKFVRIAFADNGIGFDTQYLEKIFVIFQSLHPRDQYEGTGIGLAIVKKIIEKHQGLVTAQSSPDHGATFHILLPLEQEKTKHA